MRTLHIDTGRTMQGGQWQVLYLVERLKDATLLAPEDSPLFTEAHNRGIASGKCLKTNPALVHAHDSRAHTLARLDLRLYRLPLVVSRRVGFAPKQSLFSQLKYRFVDRYLAVSKYVAMQLREAGVPASKIRVVYDGIPIPQSATKPKPGRVVAVPTKYQEIPGIPIHLKKS
jgi:hypothetical protein